MTRTDDSAGTPGASDAPKHALTVEDLYAFSRVGAPRAGAAGGGVVVPVTTHDMEQNRGVSRLWLLVDGGPPRALTAEAANSREPALSPDGRRVAFVGAKPGEPGQLHVLSLDGGEPHRLTDLPLGCCDPRWLPDGSGVVLVVPLLRDAPTPEGTRELLERRAQDPVKARVTEDRTFRFWDRWLTDGEVQHLFTCDAGDGTLRDLTPDSTRWFDLVDPSGQYDISPDGKEIAFSANSTEPPYQRTCWDVFTVPVNGGPVANLTAGAAQHNSRPRYSPDGRHILYGRRLDYSFYADRVRLVLFERGAGRHVEITGDWDRSPAGWEWSRETGHILFHAEDRARVALFAMAPGPGTPREVHRGGTLAGLSPAGGGQVCFAQDSHRAPAEVAVCREDGTGFRWLSRFNRARLATLDLGEVSEMEFEGAEGARVHMYVTRPPGFDANRKWPLVHLIHGGPHNMAGDQFAYRWNAHAFAAPGYVVAQVNFHGSTSWGQQFAECIHGAWGDLPFRDLLAATELLARQPWIDGTRVAAAGGSFGGYMAAWIAGHTDRFACLVSHAGVGDFVSQWAGDLCEENQGMMGGAPWDGLEKLEHWSPVRYAKHFRTPMLLSYGERDFRVSGNQSLELYNIYKAMGLPARLICFPDENHNIGKPQNGRLWFREVLAWLARWLG